MPAHFISISDASETVYKTAASPDFILKLPHLLKWQMQLFPPNNQCRMDDPSALHILTGN